MLFVSIVQTLAVGFTITALWKDTLMYSPEENGVTCNITQKNGYLQNITAQHLVVYWGWQTLMIRWDVEGHQDTQIWLTETYKKTYDYRCQGGSLTTHPPTTSKPTKAPHTLRPTHPTKSPTQPTTATPTTAKPTTVSASTHTQSAIFNLTENVADSRTNRKLLQFETYDEYGYRQSFQVPASLQYDSALSVRGSLPSVFYPIPPLQLTDSFGQSQVDYVYPFKLGPKVYIGDTQIYATPPPSTTYSDVSNSSNSTTPSPTLAPTASKKNGCDDLNIVIETGKSYFSLLICGLLCAGMALILLVPPTCHLVSMKLRRLLKQIVIGLNTLSFMLLLMAFAIWFAYFSTNINEVVESSGDNKQSYGVCILGSPQIGESVAYLLSGWILIGFSTIGSCYLGNRPKQWYRFLRQKRTYHEIQGAGANSLNVNGPIEEESESTSENEEEAQDNYNRMEDERVSGDSESASDSQERLATMVHRTPSNHSSGSNDTYMTAEHLSMIKGDAYPVTYSPMS